MLPDLGRTMRVQIIGRTDGIGSVEQNHFVASQRAERVAERLRINALPMPKLELRSVTQPPGISQPDVSLRRVEFRVNGNHQDPRKLLKSGETVQLAATMRPQFEQVAQGVKTQLRIAESMRGITVDAE